MHAVASFVLSGTVAGPQDIFRSRPLTFGTVPSFVALPPAGRSISTLFSVLLSWHIALFLPLGVRELSSQIYVYSFGIASVSSFLAKSFVDDTLALFLEICTGELAQGSSCLGIKSQGSEPKAAVGNPFFLFCVSRTELLIDDSPWISLGIVSVFSGLNISRKVGVSYLSSPLHSKCWGGSGAIAWVWARYVLLRP